ncbi:MAG: transporter substrate-binding domain-containing protein [Ruminococcaceae bacterium]|nr:transporter substrate-binding domain-containing protein [Oscillospiraceae bacterium]
MKRFICLALALLMLVGSAFAFTSCKDEKLLIGKSYTKLDKQSDILLKLKANNIDVGVMDSIMAGWYMSQDSNYADSLMIVPGLDLTTEQYGIAGRKGSVLIKAINSALIQLAKDGTVLELATKYGIASELCIDTTKEIATDLTEAEMTEWEAIKAKGSFVVGYTLFAPIAYKDDSGNLIGFDVELAEAVAAWLDLKVIFQEIDWEAKENLLNAGNIDCIWNGMTITPEREEAMEISIPYLNNKQVAVIRKADKDKYTTVESMSDAIMGAEKGSAGEACIKASK